MQQKDILTICLGSAIVNQNHELLSALADELAQLPIPSIKSIWRRLAPIVPIESAKWIRDALGDAIE